MRFESCRSRSPAGTFVREPTDEELSKAEPLDIRYVEYVEEIAHHTVGDLIQVSDLRRGGEEGNVTDAK